MLLIPDVSMTELVSFCLCQNQRLAGFPTQRQGVRQHGGSLRGQVSVDCLENLFLRNPLHNPADQDWIIYQSQQNVADMRQAHMKIVKLALARA